MADLTPSCAELAGTQSLEQLEQWYAAYTTPRHEKAVVRQLGVRHVESFLPLYTSLRRYKNGCQVAVEQPLFPGYVFVRVQRRHAVKALPAQEIETLRADLPRRSYEPHPYLAAGDRVRIIEGPLAGMAGVLVRRKN